MRSTRPVTTDKLLTRLLTAILVITLPASLFAATPPASPSPAAEVHANNAAAPPPLTHSFLDPIGDFARDSILHPTAPFELIPGKDPNGWSFAIEPYLWAMGIQGKTGVGGFPPINVNVSSKKLLQNFDWGLMGMGEIHKGRWGLLADGYYAALTASGDLGGGLYQNGTLQMQQGLASLSLSYRIIDDRRGFLDIYAGARYNYLGVQFDLEQDGGGIDALSQQIANNVASKITSKVESLVGSFRSQAESVFADAVEKDVSSLLLSKNSQSKPSPENVVLLERLAGPPSKRDRRDERGRSRDDRGIGRARSQDREILRAIDRQQLRDVLASARGDIRAYIRAEAAVRLAIANGTLTPELQAKSDAAKSKLGRSISNALKDSLPTYGTGDQWWIDPIIGLRGQINLTRWLFLAAQGDVGGFGVGSQITWNTQATVGINFTRNVFAELGYRFMYVDYNKNNFLYQMNSFGLFSSIGVKF